MQLIDDVRYALRQFVHAPGFTATAVLTLALGIGAITGIFTLVHAVLLSSLPVAKPSELYRIGDNENCCVNGGLQKDWSLFSYEKYKTFRDSTHGFSELAAFQAGRGLVGARRTGSNQPAESLRTQYVSGNYFSMQIVIGLAIGLPATILAGYAMTKQLFGVKPYAPGILLVTTIVLSVAALVATLLPARKAAALEPIPGLRTE
jgi:hypothetical protein